MQKRIRGKRIGKRIKGKRIRGKRIEKRIRGIGKRIRGKRIRKRKKMQQKVNGGKVGRSENTVR